MTFTWILGPLVQVVVRLCDRVLGPRLRVTVECTGGAGPKINFRATIDNLSTTKPALGCQVSAEIQGIGTLYESPSSFSLPAGKLDYPVRFGLERPRDADLVKALNDEPTLYGRTLIVRVKNGRHRAVKCQWDEARYDPQTNRARYEIQQDVWRGGQRDAP